MLRRRDMLQESAETLAAVLHDTRMPILLSHPHIGHTCCGGADARCTHSIARGCGVFRFRTFRQTTRGSRTGSKDIERRLSTFVLHKTRHYFPKSRLMNCRCCFEVHGMGCRRCAVSCTCLSVVILLHHHATELQRVQSTVELLSVRAASFRCIAIGSWGQACMPCNPRTCVPLIARASSSMDLFYIMLHFNCVSLTADEVQRQVRSSDQIWICLSG